MRSTKPGLGAILPFMVGDWTFLTSQDFHDRDDLPCKA